ncbi:cupin domain-containing protein [Acinetobacter sp. BSP-28]|uniref:cupin domain-containing protein n=1 Tax=Acinetobacter sp. BSP-28 TaxID=3344661 RepID=UPI0037700B6F
MNHMNYEDMVKGWFVGAFTPTAYSTDACEVAVKHYVAGDKESTHYHKIATEITMVLSGRIRMCDKEWGAGDIIVLSPGEITDFEALTDAINVVVKTPGVLNDKYLIEI